MFACLQSEVEAAVKVLLSLKADYKTATGKDWKPGQAPPAAESAPAVASSASQSATDLNDQITKQGDLVRKLKAEKASKVCDAEPLILNKLCGLFRWDSCRIYVMRLLWLLSVNVCFISLRSFKMAYFSFIIIVLYASFYLSQY